MKSFENKCLIVVDVQNDIVHNSEYTLYRGQIALKNISRVLEQARAINMPIVFIQHTEADGGFKRGCESWKIAPEVAPRTTEPVFEKTTCDSFLNTGLQGHLELLGAKELIIAGMQTEYCIDTTVRSAFGKGYHCTVISDGHSTFDSELITAELMVRHMHNMWSGRFADLMDTETFISEFKR